MRRPSSRLSEYLLLVLSLSVLYVTQVAIPAPCDIAATIRAAEGTTLGGSGRIDLFELDVAKILLESRNFQCRECTDILWEISRQGKLVDASLEKVGDTWEVTITKTGEPTGLQFGDTVYIEGTYEDPIGRNPITGNPFFTVTRTIRANVMIKLK